MRKFIIIILLLCQSFGFSNTIILDSTVLEDDGTLRASKISSFLTKALVGNILYESFKNANCIKSAKKETQGSFNTLQLFIIENICDPKKPKFALKEAKNSESESLNLKEIKNYPGMKELMPPGKKGYPLLALPLAFPSYIDGFNNLHNLVLMPFAEGEIFCDFVKEYRDNPSLKNEERIKLAYKTLGYVLSNFHQLFGNLKFTVNHGDMHCFNFHYDEKNNTFTFIDNESMALTLNDKKSPSDDILKLFYGLSSSSEPSARKDMIERIDLKKFYDLALKNFLLGYIEAFAKNKRKEVLRELKNIFNSDEKFLWLSIDPETLAKLRKDYVNPIFEEINKIL